MKKKLHRTALAILCCSLPTGSIMSLAIITDYFGSYDSPSIRLTVGPLSLIFGCP